MQRIRIEKYDKRNVKNDDKKRKRNEKKQKIKSRDEENHLAK